MFECLVGLLAISSRVEVINVPHGPDNPALVLLVEPLGDVTSPDLEKAQKDCPILVRLALDFDRDLPYTYGIKKHRGHNPWPSPQK